MFLLTDGSADPKNGIGFGVYLTFSELPENLSAINDSIKIKQFNNTSSTKLELQTLLWALSEISDNKIISYTDSQNIVGLLSRKEKLVKNNYYPKNGSCHFAVDARRTVFSYSTYAGSRATPQMR